ncbi:AAA family ATPase [Oerskovia sp. M15]
MADTLTLAAVVEHAVARGASVRLVGDDRQLAAIGAGGVLRDIASTHGACRSTTWCGSPIPAKVRRRWRCVTVTGPRSASTSTTTACTSATSPPASTTCTPRGRPNARPGVTV